MLGERVRREASSGETELAELIKASVKDRSHLEAQTVGSLLATIPAILEQNGLSLSSDLHGLQASVEHSLEEGMDQLGSKLAEQLSKSLAPLKDLHDLHNLEALPEKLSDHSELSEIVHDGFDSLVEKLADKTKIDDTIHDGLHEISEKLEEVNSYGLNGIMDQISKVDLHGGHHYPGGYGGHHVTAKHG